MFSVDLKDEQVIASLMRAESTLGDLRSVMESIGDLLAVSTKDRLKSGKSPDGTPFAARSPVTIAHYERKKMSFGGVLYLGGDLYNQIKSEAGSDFAEVGSTMIYAAMMHFGGTKAKFPNLWGDIPARPFLGLSEQDERDIVAEIADALAASFDP